MYEHVITLVITSENDRPEQWDWTALLDLSPDESVTVVSHETMEQDE